ncbi:IucA/IucC family C-terminal-domain containing protein [Peribacillus glennii]|uniref:Aerobactin siderophore biosynthesis IucA/IucC-like C-terminal domain-containing protein n=1 Tax=Peribacillus glennii TaxID=2303991 RepID=A0A372LDA1_9BACI|nr:IucA/IucC family C-terminal-domain containing protein [Peribacillus glennii]RFU64005.1 hypothetical protein D0466_10160 [Peribacillus glennii]
MHSKLTEHEIEILAGYRFACNAESSAFSFHAADLLSGERLHGTLLAIQERLRAPDLKVTASILMKRYSFYVVINLFAMSVLNKSINGAIENISFHDNGKPGFIPDIEYSDISADSIGCNRLKARAEICRQTFAGHLYPIIDMLSKETKLSKLILWENIAIYIFWLYETQLEQYMDLEVTERIESDFQYLVYEAPGSIFGNLHANPLHRYYSEKVLLPEREKPARIRQTCCLSYKAGAKKMCGGCPRFSRK